MGGGKHPLAFLGKKQFHTKNLKNVEAVWIEEEKEKAEQKKLADLQKQIIEERQMEDLRVMQSEAGIGKKRVQKLDWMYEGPMAGGATDPQESEEYLLGKAFEPKAVAQEVNKQISKHSEQPGALWAAKPTANDAFTRMHEDPMMKIRQQELRARESVIKNPLKMNKVKKEIENQLKLEKDAKKEKKRMKKEKKAEKKRIKKEKKDKKRKRSRSQSRSRSNSMSSEEEKEPETEKDLESRAPVRDPRFGLQTGTISRVYAKDELGPSAELRNVKKAAAAATSNSVNAKRPRERLTEEEKARRLRDMQKDAQEHDQRRTEIMLSTKASKEEDVKLPVANQGDEKDPSFLKEMGEMVYLSGNIDMEERLKRNRQNHQKDLGSDSFMRK